MGKGKDLGDVCACFGIGTFFCLFCIIVLGLIGIGIAKIAIGAVYLHDCDIENKIPIFLIVGAVVSVFFGCFGGSGNTNDDGQVTIGVGVICGLIGFLFNIAWLIAGSVWVYGTWSKVKSDSYIPCSEGNVPAGCTQGSCNDVLLTFAFATVTIDWILVGLAVTFLGFKIVKACE